MEHNSGIEKFLAGKSAHTLMLFEHFTRCFEKIGPIVMEPTKTMIGISNEHRRIAWITQLGKNFIHVVFPFDQPYEDNLCFQKVGEVSGKQFNHHFRMLQTEDVNEEVLTFMKMAYGR
ncbi:MAG: hypothetical protein HYZ14_15650 [Bacteroidetes bacterium]|nr:hypothetical protein [Bacteroidota bacterium]